MNNILILSPHTDDAELGCGGTISKLIEQNNIYWIVFSSAEESLPKGLSKDTLSLEFKSVISKLKLKEENYKIFNYKVRNLYRERQNILENLVKIRNKFKPDIVFGPSINDYHQDHQVVANEMIRAFKTSSSILSYELPWNNISFITQCFVKLNKDHIRKKCELLSLYKSQKIQNRQYFSEEYIYGLGKTRGIQCESEYAEAFEVLRWML